MVSEISGGSVDPSTGGHALSLSHALPISAGALRSRIVSLYDLMKPVAVAKFFETLHLLSLMLHEGVVISEQDKDTGRSAFDKIIQLLEGYDLACSAETAKKIRELIDRDNSTIGPTAFLELERELRGRVVDETRGREFFVLTLQEASYYKQPLRGWETIVDRFPDALRDVEEAWRCFALSRYTAAVFHSLRVAEAGVLELGTFISVNDPLSNWAAVTKKLKKILDADYRTLTPFEQQNRPFFEQIHGTIEALKNAWRNKVSHALGKLMVMTGEEFHPDVAEEILIATRAFMRRLAEGLPARVP